MAFDLRDANYKSKYKVKGIPFRGKMGIDVSDCKTSAEVIEKAKLDYTVAKCQLAAKMPAINGSRDGSLFPNIVNGHEFVDVPNSFCTYRTDTNIPLGEVRGRYEPVQNIQAFNFFDNAIGDNIKWCSAGYLGYGQKIFVTAKIQTPITIGGNDHIDQYLVFTNSHDGSSAVQIMLTPVRLWCLNMLNSARKASESYISFRHNQGVNGKLYTVPEILGFTKEKIEEEKQIYEVLFKTDVNDDDIKHYICDVFLNEKENEIVNEFKLHNALFNRDNSAFEQSGISKQKLNIITDVLDYTFTGIGQKQVEGTAWQMYNGITGYYSNVKSYTNDEKRLEVGLFGADYNVSQKALSLALELC